MRGAGWVVEVKVEGGALLYAVYAEAPHEAEDIVRRVFSIPDESEVFAIRPLDAHSLEQLNVGIGEARGPM